MKVCKANGFRHLWLTFLIGLAQTVCTLQLPAEVTQNRAKKYDATWESLRTHPVPAWFEDAKFGIFIHWGPYSVLGYREGGSGYAEHVPKEIYRKPDHYYAYLKKRFGAAPPEFGYKDVISLFKAERWHPDAWAQLFHQAGAKYVVLTAEHHDGYAMWDSDLTPWCATKIGPMRDLVGDLATAVRKKGMKYAPSYHRERHPGFFAQEDFTLRSSPQADIAEEIKRDPEAALLYGPFEYTHAFVDDYAARWKEIEAKYQPDFMWFDHIPVFHKRWCAEFDHPQIDYFRTACQQTIANYYNAAEMWGKGVYVNNKGPQGRHNWPVGVGCREKDNLRLDSIGDKWQNPATLGTSYGYLKAEEERNAYKSPTVLIHLLCDVVSKNGNLLLNIGPRADGTIPEGMQDRLLTIGEWLDINGEAIYGTRPWIMDRQESPNLRFTTKGNKLFAIALEKPNEAFVIAMGEESDDFSVQSVSLLGSDTKVEWSFVPEGVRILSPSQWPGDHAWAFRIDLKTDH